MGVSRLAATAIQRPHLSSFAPCLFLASRSSVAGSAVLMLPAGPKPCAA